MPPVIRPEDLLPYERYGSVFGQEALRVIAIGSTMKPPVPPVVMNAMGWCWSYKDSRGKPRQGGARSEVQEATQRLAEHLDPNGTSMDLVAQLERDLNRLGYHPFGALLAWITLCAALGTEAFARGVVTSDEYHLLADPFLIGTALMSADGVTPMDTEVVRAATAKGSWRK
jgi:hypothetical protein